MIIISISRRRYDNFFSSKGHHPICITTTAFDKLFEVPFEAGYRTKHIVSFHEYLLRALPLLLSCLSMKIMKKGKNKNTVEIVI